MKLISKLCHFLQYQVVDHAPPYIPTCQMRHIINAQKGLTLFWVLFLIAYFSNISYSLWIYAGIHGSYGAIWVMKDFVAPDPRWNQTATLGSFVIFILVLGFYWVIPYTIAAGYALQNPSYERSMVAVFIYAIGVVLMIGSDIQKYFVLKIKKGLISDGFFARTRNPNYLGEILLYGSFAILSGFTPNYIGLATIWLSFFAFMVNKEESYQRKEGWNEYKKKSLMFLPRLCGPYLLNYVIYALICSLVYGVYLNGGIGAIVARWSIYLHH